MKCSTVVSRWEKEQSKYGPLQMYNVLFYVKEVPSMAGILDQLSGNIPILNLNQGGKCYKGSMYKL